MWRLLSVLALAVCANAQPGWKSIMPDAKFSQWTRISIPPGKPVTEPTQWKVDAAAGTLICDGTGGHEMLRFGTEFGDFQLHVEWKYTPVADPNARYNSGVFVRNNADGSVWHQAQTGQTGAYLFGSTLLAGAPKRFNLKEQMKSNTVKPVGEWNAFDITCKGNHIVLEVNGTVVSEFQDFDVPKGYVALEAEGFRIEFKNLRVKLL